MTNLRASVISCTTKGEALLNGSTGKYYANISVDAELFGDVLLSYGVKFNGKDIELGAFGFTVIKSK